jgi:hypothetical protein
MNEAQGVAFLEALRCKNIRVKENGWIEAGCPLARWLHKHHVDATPSFGLNVRPGERSYFLCFACRQGSAEELLHTLEMYTHVSQDYDFAQCHKLLSDEEYVVPLPAYGEFPRPQQVFSEWPAYWLESFKPAEWVAESAVYLAARGVPLSIVQQFHLRFDHKRQMIVVPYWDVFGRFAGARGRSILETPPQKHHDYSFQGVNNARLVWLNEPVLNQTGPVVVVEGQFDVMRTAQAYQKTVGNLTAKPTLEKMKKLGDCETVIQIPDRDEAGEQSIGKYARFCKELGLKHKVVWLDEGVKDPAECAVAYLKDKIYEQM